MSLNFLRKKLGPAGAFSSLVFGTSIAVFAAATAGGAVARTQKESRKKDVKSSKLARVVTAMSTPLRSGHPILFLNGSANGASTAESLESRLLFPADQRYSKWSVIFDSPIRVETVEVQTCDGTKPFADGVELYVDYSEKRLYRDGGRNTVKFVVKSDARALTLGFLESSGLCLSRVTIKSTPGWLRPQTLKATGSEVIADGSIGLGPRTIFDGKKRRIVGDRKPGEWQLQWENPLIVESLRIWNGNQNHGDVFEAGDRVREIEIQTDVSKAQRSTLADRRDSQLIELNDVREIRRIEMKSISTYAGKLSSEPLLGEVQFSAGGENWIPIVPVALSSPLGVGESAESAQIRELGYGDVLDRELRIAERGDIWKFRLRSDGTFFARIFIDKARTARGWSVTGTWRLGSPGAKPATANKDKDKDKKTDAKGSALGLALSLTGTKMSTAEASDSLPCANRCFPSVGSRIPNSVRELPVSEQVELQREGRSRFILRNRTSAENRTMEFEDLKLRIHSLFD